MNKMAIAAAALAVGAGGYFLLQQDASVVKNDPMLDFIPADTVVFSGQLAPFPLKDYLYSIAGNYQVNGMDELLQLDASSSAQERFFVSLYKQYMNVLPTPDVLLTTYGLPDTIKSYFYTLGALPVMKIQLSNPSAFWAELDRAEQDSGSMHTTGKVGTTEYRAYALTDANEQEQINLVFAEKQGWLTVTLNTSFNQIELLEMALGEKTVEQPLSGTTMLQDIAKSHGFMQDSISFVNHVELIKGLTTADGNMLAKQISKMVETQGEDPFAELKVPACQTEFAAIAANWPRTVMGLNSYSISREESDIDAVVVVESNNQVILSALAKMRGFIPAFDNSDHDNILSMALGMDVSQLAPALTEVWKDLQTPSYQCEALAQMQGELDELNPAMLGMMTGMANGVKGMSVTLADYKLTEVNGEPSFEKLDALISISAENPSMLIDMVKPFFPPLASIELKDNGDPVDITPLLMLPPEFGVSAKMAVKGNHLVVYTGDKGTELADGLFKQTLSANGFFDFAVDYQKMFMPLVDVIEMSGEPMPEELEALKDYNMRLKMSFDFSDKGIVIGSKVNSKASAE
ncbi:hypothetical protein K8B83_19895 [Shewanella inventionis]|uniref:DUF3352 domain-containing protein n=1 Tax=Shewanella inventionis TaxID=1738770 RepID=A0ABQ1J2B8_9GAMM|nr:hypothetical protein [Shewanella inventionis]MCL1158995.1 hypothetical protein [Shewanella inventionis]UAL43037.1 hypothetical protein K8B83_19895 [Shewanella inventionis]GGB56945.1 hypothetical protein GCM10011607_16900 [Shewanella inventionis]